MQFKTVKLGVKLPPNPTWLRCDKFGYILAIAGYKMARNCIQVRVSIMNTLIHQKVDKTDRKTICTEIKTNTAKYC